MPRSHLLNKALFGESMPLFSTRKHLQWLNRPRLESPLRRRNPVITIQTLYLCFFIIYLNSKSTKIAASLRDERSEGTTSLTPYASRGIEHFKKEEGCSFPAPLAIVRFIGRASALVKHATRVRKVYFQKLKSLCRNIWDFNSPPSLLH
jgi:hypothetical protein